MKRTLEQSLIDLEGFERAIISELSAQLNRDEKKSSSEIISLQIKKSKRYVKLLYSQDYSLGENLSGLIQFRNFPLYVSNLELLQEYLSKGFQIVQDANKIPSQTRREFRRNTFFKFLDDYNY